MGVRYARYPTTIINFGDFISVSKLVMLLLSFGVQLMFSCMVCTL